MKTKKRLPLLAALLSFLIAGLGQVYNGQIKKGILFFLGGFALLLFLSFAGIQFSFAGLIILFFIAGVGYRLYVAVDAFVVAKKTKEIIPGKYNRWYSYVLFAVIAILISSLLNDTLKTDVLRIRSYKIPTEAMTPTVLRGDYIIAKIPLCARRLRRGDLIVFSLKADEKKKHFIKRIAGLPNEKIEIKNNRVFINDEPIKEPYAVFNGHSNILENFGPVDIPPHKVFVMSDNRFTTFDSRVFGFVDQKDIHGKALFVYFSKDRETKKIRWNRIGHKLAGVE